VAGKLSTKSPKHERTTDAGETNHLTKKGAKKNLGPQGKHQGAYKDPRTNRKKRGQTGAN